MTTNKIKIIRFKDQQRLEADEYVASEEPLQINLNGKPSTITMRTPGEDVELAIGFLFTEGLIESIEDIRDSIKVDEDSVNILTTKPDIMTQVIERNFYSTSSCGVCGKPSIDQIAAVSQYLNFKNRISINSDTLLTLPDKLRAVQETFDRTGGLHGCALFNPEGDYIVHREDVGRHNALDKLIGYAVQNQLLPLDKFVLLLSGRASFELIQKASMAGIQIVAAIGAPSSLAVSVAIDNQITLAGFLKKTGFNIYSRPDRIV
jgi:FdhD protein